METFFMDTNPSGLQVLENDLTYSLFVSQCRDLERIIEPIPLNEMCKSQEKRDIKNEFKQLLKMTENSNFDQQKIPFDADTFKLNRFDNILPYKHTLVTLKDKGANASKTDQYINADYIYDCYTKDESPMFIATQAPITNSFGHFWRMIWQENVQNIIMLCTFNEEEKKNKCDIYWPENETDKIYDYQKITLKEVVDNNVFFVAKLFEIENTETSEIRSFKHYYVKEWPDKKVPATEFTEHLEQQLNLLIEENFLSKTNESAKSPILVHCSAGIGRTGTFMCQLNLVYLLKRYHNFYMENSNLDTFQKDAMAGKLGLSIFGTVRSLREQRMGLVQTVDQYVYIYWFITIVVDKYLK